MPFASKEAHRAWHRDYIKKWRKANPEKEAAQKLRARQTSMGRYQALKDSASRRGLVVEISKDVFDVVREMPCMYCKQVLSNTGACLDRADNSFGYELTNIVPCCGRCNRAKHVMSQDEFREWIVTVYTQWAKKEVP